MLFGEEVSGKFIAKWPTFYKPRIIADCKNQSTGAYVDDLRSAQEESDNGECVVWVCFYYFDCILMGWVLQFFTTRMGQ